MKITMARVLLACDALWPLMEARGLSGGTQMQLVRLWSRLAGERDVFCAAELAVARSFGKLDEAGNVTFHDEDCAAEYHTRRGDLLREEAEIEPVTVRNDKALWEAMTPKALVQLEGLLNVEDDA